MGRKEGQVEAVKQGNFWGNFGACAALSNSGLGPEARKSGSKRQVTRQDPKTRKKIADHTTNTPFQGGKTVVLE